MSRDQHPEAVIVHSSDLHLGTDDSFSERDSLAVLPKVLSAAIEARADISDSAKRKILAENAKSFYRLSS